MGDNPDNGGQFDLEQVTADERMRVRACLEQRLQGESERFRAWAASVLFRLRPHDAPQRGDGGKSGLRYIIEEHCGEKTADGPVCFDGVFFHPEREWHVCPLPTGVGISGNEE